MYGTLSSNLDEDLDLPDYSVRKGKNKKQKVLFVYILQCTLQNTIVTNTFYIISWHDSCMRILFHSSSFELTTTNHRLGIR